MSTVIVNKVDLDLVDIEIEQTGTSTTDMFFQEPVLDHTRDYVVAVSELSVPIQEEPMLSNRRKNNYLLYIRRKVAGQDDTHADCVIGTNNPQTVQQKKDHNLSSFRIDNKRISSPTDFVRHVNKFFSAFATQYAQAANPAVVADSANFKVITDISPSAILDIAAPGYWWNAFYIELTPYGKELLGYNDDKLAKGIDGISKYVQLSRTAAGADVSRTEIFDANDQFIIDPAVAGNEWATNHGNSATHSMLRYVEHRIRVEIDADLSIPSNVLIENGVQKMHYNIGSFPIRHNYNGSISITTGNVIDRVGIESPINIGNLLVKSRSDLTSDWYTITNPANVQNMRLNLIMLRREWNRVTNKWELVRNTLVIDEKAVWNATLKFVQTF